MFMRNFFNKILLTCNFFCNVLYEQRTHKKSDNMSGLMKDSRSSQTQNLITAEEISFLTLKEFPL